MLSRRWDQATFDESPRAQTFAHAANSRVSYGSRALAKGAPQRACFRRIHGQSVELMLPDIASNDPFAGNDVYDPCGEARAKIRVHKDIQAEYAPCGRPVRTRRV